MFVETLRHESYSFALSTAPQLAMAQEQLRDVWLHAQHGRLCAWEQAKALALREASHPGAIPETWEAVGELRYAIYRR